MELLFLAILVLLMATALASGFPVAFALPGSAIVTVGLAALAGTVFEADSAAYFAQGGPINWLTAGVTNFRGIYWEVERDTLIAIPLFIFMGIMLQRSKIAEDLLVSMAQLFGPIRGGLGISVVFVGALLAATTGIVGATVVAMGLISLPAMLRNNYSHALATGTIAASGTLGQIIPPSIVLIILADQLASAVDQAATARQAYYKVTTGNFSLPSEFGVISTSAGDMFMGALVPGLVLVGLYMLYILVLAFLRPGIAPAVPFDGKYDRNFAGKVLLSLVPPLTLIFIVLGSIISGVATVNQAGAIGAAGAMVMAGYRLWDGRARAFYPAIICLASLVAIGVITNMYDINVRLIETDDDVMGVTLVSIAVGFFLFGLAWSGWRTFVEDETLRGVMIETAKTTSLVFIILLGAAMLTAAFRAFGGEELVKEFLTGLPGGFWAQFAIVMAVIFVLGFFLDFIEIAVVVVPIVAPILLLDPSANITAVWLGVMIGLNIQTSFLTPPFGFALFYLRGVAPPIVKTLSMYKGVVPFISLQLLALVIVGAMPPLVNYLPTRISLTSETAPPPKNPRLQSCIEEYTAEVHAERGDSLRATIAEANNWDLSALPERQRKTISDAIARADSTFGLLADAREATDVLQAATPDYLPIHTQVRGIQARVADDKLEIREEQNRLRFLKGNNGNPNLIAKVEAHVDDLEAEIERLENEVPAAWPERRKAFEKLLAAEKKARFAYRRASDSAYDPIARLQATLSGAADLKALENRVLELPDAVASAASDQEAHDTVESLERAMIGIPETSSIRSAFSKVRRDLRGRRANRQRALEELEEAIATYREETEWRMAARETLLEEVTAYEEAIRDTIGLRAQSRMPRDIALYVAACNADHKDLSIYF